jgi:hypothetical protein
VAHQVDIGMSAGVPLLAAKPTVIFSGAGIAFDLNLLARPMRADRSLR